MGKNRELAKLVSKQTFRTIVVAGAMLGAPIVIGCGGGNKPTPVKPTPADPALPDPAMQKKADDDKKAADDKAAADAKAKADEDARLLAEKAAADKAAQDEADKKAAEDAKKRPRGGGNRPTGRGFILS
jgi:hypothetical protein